MSSSCCGSGCCAGVPERPAAARIPPPTGAPAARWGPPGCGCRVPVPSRRSAPPSRGMAVGRARRRGHAPGPAAPRGGRACPAPHRPQFQGHRPVGRMAGGQQHQHRGRAAVPQQQPQLHPGSGPRRSRVSGATTSRSKPRRPHCAMVRSPRSARPGGPAAGCGIASCASGRCRPPGCGRGAGARGVVGLHGPSMGKTWTRSLRPASGLAEGCGGTYGRVLPTLYIATPGRAGRPPAANDRALTGWACPVST
jgi:hypothetical protein